MDGIFRKIGIIRCEKAYKLYYQDSSSFSGIRFFVYDFCFEDYLPLFSDIHAEVEEGDIINIRTLTDLNFPPYSAQDIESYTNIDPHIGNTYLATFLIELDPL